MDRQIKQEPLFEEEGDDAGTGGMLMPSCPISMKNETDNFHPDSNVAGPSIKSDPESLGLVKLEDIATSRSLQAAGQRDHEPEENLSDEGIGRSPDASEYVVQSHSEEEGGTSTNVHVQDPQEGLISETRVDKQLFYCDNCGMAFTDESHLLRHMKVHTFICQFCGKQFSSDLELLEHEDIHRETQEHCCNECNIIFDSKAALEEHYGNHVYACSLCPKTFTNNIAMLNHERGHQDPSLNCNDCGRTFKRLSNLNVHKQKFCCARSQFGSYQNVGPKTGVKQRNIEEATETDYEVDDKVNDGWEADDRTSRGVKALTPKRGKDMYFHCTECPKAFSNSEDFAKHKLTHPGSSGSITSTVQFLKAQARQESTTYSDGFECKDCETTYPSLAALQSHYLKHKYPCELCDKTFTNFKKLKRHVSGHDLVFPCQKCQRQFKKEHFLKAHLEKVHRLCANDVSGKGGTSSTRAPSEAKSPVKLSSTTSLLSNQVVKKHDSPQLSHKYVEDSEKNFKKAELVLEKTQISIAMLEGSSAETPLYKCRICQKSYARKCDLTMHMKRGKHKHPHQHTSSGLQMELPSHEQLSTRSSELLTELPSSATFKCSVCPKTFLTEYNLIMHIKSGKHENDESVQGRNLNKQPGIEFHCKICLETFAHKRYLIDHIKRKHSEIKSDNKVNSEVLNKSNSVTLECKKCKKRFHRKSDLTMHMKLGKHQSTSQEGNSAIKESETEVLPKMFKCTKCPKAYAHKCHLQRHFKQKHLQQLSNSKETMKSPSSSSDFRCKICPKTFSSQYGLSVHLKLGKHESSSIIQCNICSKIFKQKRYLTDHMKRKHQGLRRENSRAEGLKRSQAAEFHCRRCPKTFHRKSDLTMHMRHGKHEKVSQQRKGPVEGSELGLQKIFKCTKCPKAYGSNSLLLRHIRLKHPNSRNQNTNPSSSSSTCTPSVGPGLRLPKIFKCSICPKAYGKKCILQRHIRLKHSDSSDQNIKSNPGFRCKICFQFFAQKRYLLDHTKRKHPEIGRNYNRIVEVLKESLSAEFHCRICPKSFHRKSDFTRHMSQGKHENAHGEAKGAIVGSEFGLRKIFKCRECPRAYGTKNLLQRHIILKHPDSIKQNINPSPSNTMPSCKECSKTFSRRYDLKVHMKLKHKSSIPRKDIKLDRLQTCRSGIPCSICPKVFAHKRYLSAHMKQKHPQCRTGEVISRKVPVKLSESRYVCKKCQKTFARKCNFNKHMRRCKHQRIDIKRESRSNLSQSVKYECTECPKSYSSHSNLWRHMIQKHPLNQCQKCPKSFACKRKLAIHMKCRHPGSPYQKSDRKGSSLTCPQCLKSFSRKYTLSQHMKKMNHKYPLHGSRASHEAPASGSSMFAHQCPQCPKAFPSKFGLTMHMKLGKHVIVQNNSTQVRGSEDLVYQCKKCPRVFNRQSDFTQHMKLGNHMTEGSAQKYFQCPKCPRSFTRKDTLLNHIQKGEHMLLNHISKDNQQKEVKESSASAVQCSACSKSFAKQGDLTKHLKYCKHQVHRDQSVEQEGTSGSTMFKCSKCTRSYARQCYLQKHMDLKHSRDEINSGTEDEEEEVISKEERTVVSKISKGPLLSGKEVGKTASSAEKASSLKMPWKCPECGKHFASSADLKRHQDTHVFMCNYCNRFFTTQNSLKEHACAQRKNASPVASNLSPKNPKVAHKCELCKTSFSSSKDLEVHQEQHTLNEFEDDETTTSTSTKPLQSMKAIPDRILICRFCDKVFPSLELVHNHERSHMS